jgi:predicted ATPase
MTADIIRFGRFEFDRVEHQLRQNGAVVRLEPIPLDLLFLLLEKPGQLLTRDEIYQRIWGDKVFVDAESAINTAIRKVRRALNDQSPTPQLVIRVSGRGYRFAGRLEGANHRLTLNTSSPKLVGRAREMAELHVALADTMSGHGRFALVSGEPGIGKSRICTELGAEAEKNGMAVVIGRCIEQEAVAYLPFVEILEGYVERSQNPDELRRAMGEEGPVLGRLLPKLQRILPELPPPPELGVEQARRHLFNCVCDFIARRAREQPTLVILEDLHWADDSTLALIDHLSQRDLSLPLMVVGTFRSSRADLNPNLTRSLEGLVRARRAFEIRLEGLDHGHVALMLQALSGHTAPAEVTKEFYARTDGNPFFVEELFRHLVEENRLYDVAGRIRVEMAMRDTEVPPNVGLVVGRRLGRLREATNNILSVAAVIGRSFSCELLEAASGMPRDLLLEGLDEAEQVGLVRSISDVQARAEFSHELTRAAILNRLSAARRQQLHREVAAAIERIYPDSLEDHVDALGHHYSHSNNAEKAIEYLSRAGQQALRRWAHEQAVRNLNGAIERLRTLPDSPERKKRELSLRLILGPCLLAFTGWGTREVERNSAHARELCTALGDPPELFGVSYGLWSVRWARAEMRAAKDAALLLLARAEEMHDPAALGMAHLAMGMTLHFMGEATLAAKHFRSALSLDDSDHRPQGQMDIDHRVHRLYYLAWALIHVGYPEQALQSALEAMARARTLSHPHTTAYANAYFGMISLLRREPDEAREVGEQLFAMCSEYGVADFLAAAIGIRGTVLASRGHEEGIPLIEQWVASGRKTGLKIAQPLELCWLAEACIAFNHFDQASEALDEALTIAESDGARYCEAETHRLRGELLLRKSKSSRVEAETCFVRATEVARQQSARWWELRATVSLARLLVKQGRRDEAHKMLSDFYSWFTEGFGTADLKEAKALLDKLSNSP